MPSSHGPLIGAIADDLTGATDLAGSLAREGMRVALVLGVPDAETPKLTGEDAVVVALKSRSNLAQEAVAQSLESARWLVASGVERLYFKYCSTFDSTAKGNIGPVADALMDELRVGLTVVAPAFPRNDRTVYRGQLFVGDLPLSESGMRDHPITPMSDSSLSRLLSAQTPALVGLVSWPTVVQGSAAVGEALSRLEDGGHRYAVVDAICDADLDTLAQAVQDARLATGGSALAGAIARQLLSAGLFTRSEDSLPPASTGPAVVLAGSCSIATLAQVERMRETSPALELDPSRFAECDPVDPALQWAEQHLGTGPVLIYSSAAPDRVAYSREVLGADAGVEIERVMGRLARGLLDLGVRRFLVAGGETSGAVSAALGVRSLAVGREIAPGVPLTASLDGEPVRLVFKSGNFGDVDFLATALARLGGVA